VTAVLIAIVLNLRNVPFMFFIGLPEAVLAPIRTRWPGCKSISKPTTAWELIAAVTDLREHPAMSVQRLH